MSNRFNIGTIASGYRLIRDGKQYNKYFTRPEDRDRIIIKDGEVGQTVDLMKRVVWKYLGDTRQIANYLKGSSLRHTCENIWNFLYHHIQYKLDKKGLEQLRRPNRSWAERKTGIDCDCFSIFVSSILTNLKIPHRFRITKYDRDEFQHVYVIVPANGSRGYYIIDCVLNRFNYEKPFTEKKDFTMNLNGINVAVLSGAGANDVMDLVSGLDDMELQGADNEASRLQAIYEHLVKTRNIIASKPELIKNVDHPASFLKMLDYAIENWNTPNREKALAILAKNEDAINRANGMSGVSDDPEMDGIDDKYLELNGDENYLEGLGGFKSFFKKVGQALKKGGRFFLRFNPITMAARGGFLLAMKLNIKKMASKLKWGYATKEQAAAKGISAAKWEQSKKALAKVENLFVDKLFGTRGALRKAILNGKAGGLNGVDFETDLTGIGALPAAALAAALPLITKTLNILKETGVIKQEEADNIQAAVNAKTAGMTTATSETDTKNSTDAGGSVNTSDGGNSHIADSQSGGGIIGFIKKQPLLAIGGLALGVWGLSKLFGGKKSGKGLSGFKSKKKKKNTHKSQSQSKSKRHKSRKLRAITLT